MSQPIHFASLSATPGTGFEQPFEMLQACHERVQRMLSLLARLREHLHGRGADEQARQAARDVMRYFDMAAPQHHLDEERHVFPPLLVQGDPRVMAVVRRLQEEHRWMEQRWAAARVRLAAIAEGNLQALAPPDEDALEEFAGLYAGHIEAEEQIAYPAATALLKGEALEAMSQEMMGRRGLLSSV